MKKFIIVLINVLTRVLVFAVSYAAYIVLNICMYRESWSSLLKQSGYFDGLIIGCGVFLAFLTVWTVDRLILRSQSGHIYKSFIEWLLERIEA